MTNQLQWAQEIPSDWSVKPLRAVSDYVVSNVDKVPVDGEPVVRLCNYSDVYNNEFITQQLDFMVSSASEDEIRKFGLIVDDVIITKDSESWDDIGVPALVVETTDDLVCGYHLALLRPNPSTLSGRFLLRCLQAKVIRLQLELAANGITRYGLPKSQIGSMRLPIPPIATQVAISAFVDRELARIDNLLVAKLCLLDLLAEKRKAVTATVVTRGLDQKAKLRDSGVAWLGEIPAHWKMTRLKFVARVQTGIALGKDYGGQATMEFPYLRVANVQDGFIDLTEVKTMAVPEREAASATLRTGDVLMNEGGDADKLGRGAIWDGSIGPCLHQNHVFALRPTSVTSEWLSTWTGADFAKAYFETRAKQSTNLASISSTNLLELPIAIPPKGEQHAIIEHLTREIAKLDAVHAATQRTIVLLKERRGALVSAAVTGQLDVGAVA